MPRRIACFSMVVFWVLYGSIVFAGGPLKAPRCVERVCLDRIERYRNIVKATRDDNSGPIVFLNDDEGYVSAESDGLVGSNWVQLSFCESPGVIKTIHRTTTVDKGADYAMVLASYEMRYGQGKNIDPGGTVYEMGHRWEWTSPATELSLMKIRDSKYFSIELHDLSLEEKDFKCAGRPAPQKKITAASSPGELGGTRGRDSTEMMGPTSGMEDNMDLGLTVHEVLYIMCMQDLMQLLKDMIRVQEKLIGAVGPAEKESIRQELKRIREGTRRIGLDYRSALLSQLRSQ
jgi:hypothetical protein